MTASQPSIASLRAEGETRSLLAAIRRGSIDALGPLLEVYRNYLHLLARTQIDDKLRGRICASDLVQETLLGACRDFSQFRGANERQLLAWLRQILINRLHGFVQEHILARKRDVRREVSLDRIHTAVTRSAANLHAGHLVAANVRSPSSLASRRENAVALANHLARMSSDHRLVIEMRNLRGESFAEIARVMQRGEAATRMLWMRAVDKLGKMMRAEAV